MAMKLLFAAVLVSSTALADPAPSCGLPDSDACKAGDHVLLQRTAHASVHRERAGGRVHAGASLLEAKDLGAAADVYGALQNGREVMTNLLSDDPELKMLPDEALRLLTTRKEVKAAMKVAVKTRRNRADRQKKANEAGGESGQGRQKTPTTQAEESRADGESKPGDQQAPVMAQDEEAQSEHWPGWVDDAAAEADDFLRPAVRRRRSRRRSEWKNRGKGKCVRSEDGSEPAETYFPGIGEDQCKEKCANSGCDCHGISVSKWNNCILWGDGVVISDLPYGGKSARGGLTAGGVEWGGANCIQKDASKWCEPAGFSSKR